MTIEEILIFLDKHEIDYRLESNFCCGYVFYFLDGSIYPRRYYDSVLEGSEQKIICQSVEHLITNAVSNELVKDWIHRIEGESLKDTFIEVEQYLKANCSYF